MESEAVWEEEEKRRRKMASAWRTEAPQVLFKWVTIKANGFLKDSRFLYIKKNPEQSLFLWNILNVSKIPPGYHEIIRCLQEKDSKT